MRCEALLAGIDTHRIKPCVLFLAPASRTHRACDYVRLVGVLARENASFVAAHVRERYAGAAKGRK